MDATRGLVGPARRAVRLVDLVSQAGRKHAGAFADLYDETSPLVYGFALSIARSPELATVLTQEIYAEAWRQAPRYDPSEGNVVAWLMSMAHRHVVDRVRSMDKEAVPERQAVLSGRGEFDRVGRDGGSRQHAESARRALFSLDPIQREAVELAYFGGYSQAEVARILGLPLDAVTTSIRDGLVALRAAMGGG